ncbi:hypothetical protein KEJ18_02595 [Candidatus Bathyarchaeota archaeon]|nr:hypothetical protein [Candidatus Bathyarchaeota archaeon]
MKKESNVSGQETGWVPFKYPWDDAPIDLSFLYKDEKPAGKHGFLKVKDDKFIFDDGVEARFWGTCFNSAANFPPHELSEKVARRLAKFGLNMVRTHQLDAEWSTPNIFQFTKGRLPENTLSFDPKSLDRLDYLIYCLKKEGIYIYLDQLTYRKFRIGDGIDAVDELGEAAKPYTNFDPKLIELQKKYSYDLWTHVNPYTGLAYKDDPAIALMEFANENDLFSQQVTLEPYRSRLEIQYRGWAKERGIHVSDRKLDFTTPTEQILRFLHDIQQDYYREMTKYLRCIGVKVPVTGSNWSQSLTLLSSLRATEYTDSHNYWDFWDVPGKEGSSNRVTTGEKRNVFETLSFNRLLDRPFVVSEWDQPWPNEWRAESPLLMAAVAAFQSWSGVIIHTYRYRCSEPADCIGGVIMGGRRYRRNFETFNDPAKFGLFYQAALMFRRRDIEPAIKTLGIKISEENIFKFPNDVETVPALVIASEKHKVGIVLPGQEPHVDFMISPTDTTIVDQCENEITSDTHQLYRNWLKRIGWIDTPRTKAAYGFLGEIREISLNDLKLKVRTRFAVIAISSLTDKPINESPNLLLTAIGRANNTGVKYNADHTLQLDVGHGPTLIEAIEATIELTTTQSHLTVWSINPEGLYTGMIPTEYNEGKLRIEIGNMFPSMYYLIQG